MLIVIVLREFVSLIYCHPRTFLVLGHSNKLYALTLIWVGGYFTPRPCMFSLNNSEMVKAVRYFAAFNNILLEAFMPNLVFHACPSFQILSKTQINVFLISEFLVNPL